MRRALFVLSAISLALAVPATARAQADGSPSLRIRAARRDTIIAAATVTGAFAVSGDRDSIQVTPHIELPESWTVLMGGSSFVLRRGAPEMLILSIVVPARAAAGVYPVRVWLTSAADPKGVMDSLAVVVPARRALEIGLTDRPNFIVSGKPYHAGFVVRNRGNMATVVHLAARSSLGTVLVPDTSVALEAEASRVIRATVRTPPGIESATDDVLEITATQSGDTAAPSTASARVTIVPEPSRKIEEYLKVPTEIHLRAASTDGVSPFEVFGRGLVRDGSKTRVDFALRGPTGKFSAFGERDEYRLELGAPNWRARLGDQIYMLSTLTGGAQPGFGLGADATRGVFSAGGYGQQFRRTAEKGSETGAFVSARPIPDARLAFNFANRAGGISPGQVGSFAASLARPSYSADVELARSQSASRPGMARSARVSGAASGFTYDAGHVFADTTFSGTQRGTEHDYISASAHQLDFVSFSLNASTHRSDLSRSTGVPYTERFDGAMLSATVLERVTAEFNTVARTTTVQGVARDAWQHGVRARADQQTLLGLVTLEGDLGRAKEFGQELRVYSDVSLGLRHSFRRGSLGLWTERYTGGSITKGTEGTVTFGGDAAMHLNQKTDMTLMGYATRMRTPAAAWNSQIDALVSYVLPNGNRLSMRARILGGGNIPVADQSVAYLEYSLPLRLPVSRLRTTGRVYGRVVDAVTGQGVRGALVRLGPQVAITDNHGQVAFGGVPAGEHRVSMSQETSFADAVFVGDPTLNVDSTRTQPTTFELAIARSARVDIDVHRYVMARTGMGGEPDSVTDAGAYANATLVMAGERDTLYRTSGQNGKAAFTDVPPGKWTISIRGDAPAFHRFDPDRVELVLAPGETKAMSFRLLPRRREVQLIGDGQELRPTASDPKATIPASTGTKTGKPNERQQR